MKIFLLSCFLFFGFQKNPSDLSDRLSNENEEIIISFLTSNQKVVSVCREKAGNYIVYRFGKKERVELQYPAVLNKDSWKLFHYRGAWRFGGKENAGFGNLSLRFENGSVEYKIFQQWSDEDESSDFGLQVRTKGTKAKTLVVNKSSMEGSLMRLNNFSEIENEAIE